MVHEYEHERESLDSLSDEGNEGVERFLFGSPSFLVVRTIVAVGDAGELGSGTGGEELRVPGLEIGKKRD